MDDDPIPVATGPARHASATVPSSTVSLLDLAPRIRTGCLYEPQPAGTFGVLVTRQAPRRLQRVQAVVRAHWPWFAPSFLLLTGHTSPCTHRRCRHDDTNAAGHQCDVPRHDSSSAGRGRTAYRGRIGPLASSRPLAVVRQWRSGCRRSRPSHCSPLSRACLVALPWRPGRSAVSSCPIPSDTSCMPGCSVGPASSETASRNHQRSPTEQEVNISD